MDDESLMPFGEFKNRKLVNVPASYLIFLYEEEKCDEELKEYIEDNLEILKREKKQEWK